MGDPLIIAALVLAGVAAAGLVIDAQALGGRPTRAYGASALCIKGVLGLAVLLELLRIRVIPDGLYANAAGDPMFAALVAMSLPLMGVAITCEILALPRLVRPHLSRKAQRLARIDGAD